MADEVIGSVSVQVVADYSKLSQGFQAAQGEASKAGASIASSFQQAAGPASGLESAVNRIVAVIQQESAAASLATQRNLALSGARGAAAGAAEDHARAARHEITEIQGTSAAIRTLEGNAGLRAVENFLAKTLGLGPVFKTIFPIVGAIAFFEILSQIGEKLYEIFSASPLEKARGEFAALDRSVELTNDALQVTNDKLDNQIAKLTGKRQNTLKLMLDEAKESADKLAESLTKGLKALYDLLKQNEPGFLARITGTAGTGDITKSVGGKTGFGGPNKEVEAISAQGRSALDGAKTLDEKNRVIKDTNDRIIGVFDEQIKANQEKLRQAEAELARRKNPALQLGGINLTGAGGASRETAPTKDTEARIELLAKTIRNLEAQKQTSLLSTEAGPKKDVVAGLEAAHAAAQEQYKLWEDEIARMKAYDAVTLAEETKFWQDRLRIAAAGGAGFRDIVRSIDTKIGQLHQEAIRQSITAGNKSEDETFKDIERHIKQAVEAATEAGGHPAQTKLDMLNDLTSSDNGLSAGNYQKLQDQKEEAQKAANREATAGLKKSLAEQDQAWMESGIRTAAEIKRRAEITRDQLEDVRLFFVGIDSLIDAETAKIIAANKRIESEKLRVADLVAKNQESGGQTEIESRRIALESAYGLQVVHTFQQQLSYQQQLAALDAESLQLKQGLADAEYRAAVASRDQVRIQEALNAQAAAGAAIELQAQKADADRKKLEHSNSFTGRLQTGLLADAEGAVSKISGGIANLVTMTKGWGQEFKNILKDIEKSIIQTFAHEALKSGLNKLLEFGKSKLGGGGGGGGVLGTTVGAAGGATATIRSNQLATIQAATERANTAAVQLLTAAIQQLIAALGADTSATAADTTSTAANTGAVITNTAATIANTAAIVMKMILDTILHFIPGGSSVSGAGAKGGKPKAGEEWLVGEEGPEVVTFPGDATIHPHAKSMQMMAAASRAGGSTGSIPNLLAALQQQAARSSLPSLPGIPGAPASAFISANQAHSISSSTASTVTNQNTGSIGQMNFHINSTQSPREVARQIANEIKRATPKYSPVSG